jgi:hypothetical protein
MSRAIAAYRGWKRRRENDERATVNLEPHLIPLWRRIGGARLGESPHERAEALTEYAEEHPGEVLDALQDYSDAIVRQLVANACPRPARRHARKTQAERIRAASKRLAKRIASHTGRG